MKIRRLDAEDAPELRALWAEGLRNLPESFLLTEAELLAIPDNSFAAGIPSALWLGGFVEDRLVGYVLARRGSVERLRHTADIGPLYVTGSQQGQGQGRALMQAALDHLIQDGLLQVELTVDAANEVAVALYTSLGFIVFGRRPRSVLIEGTPRTDLLMIRALDSFGFDTNA